MTDVEDRLRSALRTVVPAEPDTRGLAAGALRYHQRARRRRLASAVFVAVTVVAILAVVVSLLLTPPPRVLRAEPDPMTSAGNCAASAQPANPSEVESAAPPAVRAAWICPDPAGPADGEGWLLPVMPLTGGHAANLHALVGPLDRSIGPAGPGGPETDCGQLVAGPAFILVVQTTDGRVASYRSRDLSCGGADLLAFFLEALADQEADDRAAAAPDEALACRTERAWTERHPSVPLDSAFVAARMCFAPRYRSGGPERFVQPMVARSYMSVELPQEALAMLNQDMTFPGTTHFSGNGACYGEGAWLYSIVGRTASGQYKMLNTWCLDEFWLVGASRTGFIPSPATTASLRALVPPE